MNQRPEELYIVRRRGTLRVFQNRSRMIRELRRDVDLYRHLVERYDREPRGHTYLNILNSILDTEIIVVNSSTTERVSDVIQEET